MPFRRAVPLLLALSILLSVPLVATAQEDSEPSTAELDLDELRSVKIELASGVPKPLARAPAVANVITAEEIEATGAQHLVDVLEMIPGLHVIPSADRGLHPIYSIRGIHSEVAAEVLILVNGVPITEFLQGGAVHGFRLPVSSIARVEVLRGPGSAIYGADAFGGVVDIITKAPGENPGTEFGIVGGTFGTRAAWLQHSGQWGDWNVAYGIDWSASDGDAGRVIDVDAQTLIDEQLGTSASLAPGPLASHYEVLNARLELSRQSWTMRLWGWENVRGFGAGSGQALDPDVEQESEQVLLDIVRNDRSASGRWELRQRLSHLYSDQFGPFTVFPPGALLPIGSDGNVNFAAPVNLVLFPDGLIGQPGARQNVTTLDSVALYSCECGHRVRLNAGFEFTDLDARVRQNFGPGVIDGTQLVVDGTLTDVTDTPFSFLEDQSRDHFYVSLQDEIRLASDWELTLGARYDHYSDFGDTLNPRIAVVWIPSDALSAKLLYGSAFRAPSFGQLFARNNPVGLGNPDLKPQTIDTVELVFDFRLTDSVRSVLSLFSYDGEDLIFAVPDPGQTTATARNAIEQSGRGFELEATWQPRDDVRIYGSYAWLDPDVESILPGFPASPAVPIVERQWLLSGRWSVGGRWSAYAQVKGIGSRDRALWDSRPATDDFVVTNLTVRRHEIAPNLDLALIGRNVLDEDGIEPAFPSDYPVEGRSLLLELRFSLDD